MMMVIMVVVVMMVMVIEDSGNDDGWVIWECVGVVVGLGVCCVWGLVVGWG